MRKSRRGAAGLLLGLMLVVPAPVLAGCRQSARVVEQGVDDAARGVGQSGRDVTKRVAPAGGAAGAGAACEYSDKCP